MRIRWIAAALVWVLCGSGLARALTGGRIDWETDLSAARARAKEQGRPLMIYFYGEL